MGRLRRSDSAGSSALAVASKRRTKVVMLSTRLKGESGEAGQACNPACSRTDQGRAMSGRKRMPPQSDPVLAELLRWMNGLGIQPDVLPAAMKAVGAAAEDI